MNNRRYTHTIKSAKFAGAVMYNFMLLLLLLQIIFISLKLCKVIDWNWALVLLPSIVGASLLVIFLFVLLSVAFIFRDKRLGIKLRDTVYQYQLNYVNSSNKNDKSK